MCGGGGVGGGGEHQLPVTETVFIQVTQSTATPLGNNATKFSREVSWGGENGGYSLTTCTRSHFPFVQPAKW